MTYHVIETPDHLHRGVHLFAAHHLHALISGIREAQVNDLSLNKLEFDIGRTWFLREILSPIKPRKHQPHWLANKEAQEFYRQHPEIKPKMSEPFRDWKYDSEYEPRVEEIDEFQREYEDYEIQEDMVFADSAPVVEAIRNIEYALHEESIESLYNATTSLIGILQEHADPPQTLLQGLEILSELLAAATKLDARLLDGEDSEAYEVIKACRGKFREIAKQGIVSLRTIAPRDFEGVIAELFAQLGLHNVHLTSAVADDGVDITGLRFQDGKRLKYIIQCKRYSLDNRVDVRVVRELAGVKMDVRATHALLVTTSEFTKPARDYAKRSRPEIWGVRLINYKVLQKLLALTD
jgi:hypothetical protein